MTPNDKEEMELQEAILNRRTHKLYDGSEAPVAEIKKWLEKSLLAPNHRRNEPWRFVLVGKPSLEDFWIKLESKFAELLPDLEPEKIESKKEKMEKLFKTAGALVFITSQKDERDVVEKENYAAVSCLIQNFMLVAHEAGFGTFWSTSKILMSPNLSDLVGYDSTNSEMAGAIFIGKATGKPTPPRYTLDDKFNLWAAE